MSAVTLVSPAVPMLPGETNRERCSRVLGLLAFALRAGRSWCDRLTLVRLLFKRIAVRLRWARFTGRLHRVDIRSGSQTLCTHLRDNGTDSIIFNDVFHTACYDPGVLSPAPRVVVDAGANIGLASLYLASICPEASIYAFEPVEHAMTWQNAVSGRMKVFEMALGKTDGTCNILVDPSNSGGHRLEVYDPHTTLRRLKVSLHRLDTLIDSHKLPAPDLLKIDAEGAECDILEGLGRHVDHLETLICETQSPANHRWIMDFLRTQNFSSVDERIHHPEATRPDEAYSIIIAHRHLADPAA